MTIECRQLIKSLGFGELEYKDLEYMLSRASPDRIASAVKKYGKGEKHAAAWYLPLFKNGYIKSQYAFDCSFDEDFWKAYLLLDSVCEMNTFDLPYIDAMRSSFPRLRKALSQSKVMNVRYIYKVWQGIKEEKIVNNVDKVQQSFKANVVKVVNL